MEETVRHFWTNYHFKSHYTFRPSLSCFQCFSSWPLSSAVYDSPPFLLFLKPLQIHSLFPKLSCNTGLQSGRGLLCGCLGSWLSFPWRRGFSRRRVCCWYSVRLHLEHAALGLFTRQAGEGRRRGDSERVVPSTLQTSLAALNQFHLRVSGTN